jgi:hypothetical protein
MPPDADLSRGLPPVSAPSGKFIAQLFLVPFLIVACLIGFALFVKWFAGTALTPEEYLERLDNSNPDVRWRAAETLAQVLLRDDQLAANPKFALDLADRLRRAWQTQRADEKDLAERLRKQGKPQETEQKSLDAGREHLLYLSACLGNLMLPVGAPLLSEMAVYQQGMDPKALARFRWRAVWALANLGESVKRFDKLTPDRQQAVLAELYNQASLGSGERADRARKAREYLSAAPGTRSLQTLGVDDGLVQCAQDADPFLREMTAFALNFWEGTAAENARLDDLLLKLSVDDGHGEDALARLQDESKPENEQAVASSPGLKIRYNATVALARRGSDQVRLSVLREMLDLNRQQENFRLKRKDGQIVPDEATVTVTVTTALAALAEMHRRKPGRDLSDFYPTVEELAKNSNPALRSEALRTQAALDLK